MLLVPSCVVYTSCVMSLLDRVEIVAGERTSRQLLRDHISRHPGMEVTGSYKQSSGVI